jgi:cholesterol transport system auxiliary component
MLIFTCAWPALAGCVSVLPKADPASPRYLVAAAQFPEESGAPVSWSLTVEDPQATRVYDNAKIALAREAGRVEFFADGEWADRGPRLFQAALIRSFENTGRILAVGDRTMQPVGDFALQTDIRKMEADFSGAKPRAVFSVYGRLVGSRGKALAARLFEAEAEIGPGGTKDVARALDQAIGETLKEMVEWSLLEAETARAKAS